MTDAWETLIGTRPIWLRRPPSPRPNPSTKCSSTRQQECNSDKGPAEEVLPYPFAPGNLGCLRALRMAQPKGHDKPSQRHLNEKKIAIQPKNGVVSCKQSVARWPFGLLPHASLSTRITALPAHCPPFPPPDPSSPRGPGPGMFPAWSRRTASLHFHPGRPPSLWPPAHRCPLGSRPLPAHAT